MTDKGNRSLQRLIKEIDLDIKACEYMRKEKSLLVFVLCRISISHYAISISRANKCRTPIRVRHRIVAQPF